ncbi:hypothetical protein RHMOL_Rhmol01G0311400 [Rhododendron molle]|uniref:Uncharacterized protein n=1 Tax=Rhododendron molle TaxID=49168 RepID=A0ACC0QA76_RHOML|nr:hypothetical protein RHMOL_Rhmol01G0311400 [Rhododendron molle]
MQVYVMEPNVSAADEAHYIYKDFPRIVSDVDMRFVASMLTDEQRLFIRSLEHLMLTDDDDDDGHDDDTVDEYTRSLVSILADSSPTPQDPADRGPQNNILNPRVEDRNYKKFTPEEVEKLIRGVEQYGRSWEKIRNELFSDSSRTTQQLKEKWRHMTLDTVTDLRRTDLYMRAKEVDARYPKDARSARFRNTNNN